MYQSPLADIFSARQIIAKEYKVAEEFVVYSITQDNSEYGLSDLLYFDIVDKTHERYKGTFTVPQQDLCNKCED